MADVRPGFFDDARPAVKTDRREKSSRELISNAVRKSPLDRRGEILSSDFSKSRHVSHGNRFRRIASINLEDSRKRMSLSTYIYMCVIDARLRFNYR